MSSTSPNTTDPKVELATSPASKLGFRFALKGGQPASLRHDLVSTLIIPVPSPKGWVISLMIHLGVLIAMGLWYFSVPVKSPIRFDGALAGSENGISDGIMLAGGLNTPLDMPDAPIEIAEPFPETLEMTDILAPEALTTAKGARRPSAAGGIANDNPGAGDGDGFGLARFGDGGETIRGVEVKVGDPQFTLLWNNDADLDLHVIEPGGKEIYWEDPKGNHGGELDVDNTKGFGPENIYWLVDSNGPGSEKVKGIGPPGVYKWFVVYWGGFGGIAKPTHWKVRVKHNGVVSIFDGKFRSLNERSKTYSFKVDSTPARSSASKAISDKLKQ